MGKREAWWVSECDKSAAKVCQNGLATLMAINEAPELQMDEALRIGEVYGLPGHGFHHRGRRHVSWLEFHGLSLLAYAILDRFTSSRPKPR